MVVTVLVSKMVSGPKPLTVYLNAFVVRLAIIGCFSIAFATLTYDPADGNGGTLILVFVVLTVLYRIPTIIMFTSLMSFYAKIADPAMGGSYMTLLNTITNLGSMWNSQVGLRAISAIDDGCEGVYPVWLTCCLSTHKITV
jgi:PAT family acetyl-CoA transporter-like MFS transporter 1